MCITLVLGVSIRISLNVLMFKHQTMFLTLSVAAAPLFASGCSVSVQSALIGQLSQA